MIFEIYVQPDERFCVYVPLHQKPPRYVLRAVETDAVVRVRKDLRVKKIDEFSYHWREVCAQSRFPYGSDPQYGHGMYLKNDDETLAVLVHSVATILQSIAIAVDCNDTYYRRLTFPPNFTWSCQRRSKRRQRFVPHLATYAETEETSSSASEVSPPRRPRHYVIRDECKIVFNIGDQLDEGTDGDTSIPLKKNKKPKNLYRLVPPEKTDSEAIFCESWELVTIPLHEQMEEVVEEEPEPQKKEDEKLSREALRQLKRRKCRNACKKRRQQKRKEKPPLPAVSPNPQVADELKKQEAPSPSSIQSASATLTLAPQVSYLLDEKVLWDEDKSRQQSNNVIRYEELRIDCTFEIIGRDLLSVLCDLIFSIRLIASLFRTMKEWKVIDSTVACRLCDFTSVFRWDCETEECIFPMIAHAMSFAEFQMGAFAFGLANWIKKEQLIRPLASPHSNNPVKGAVSAFWVAVRVDMEMLCQIWMGTLRELQNEERAKQLHIFLYQMLTLCKSYYSQHWTLEQALHAFFSTGSKTCRSLTQGCICLERYCTVNLYQQWIKERGSSFHSMTTTFKQRVYSKLLLKAFKEDKRKATCPTPLVCKTPTEICKSS